MREPFDPEIAKAAQIQKDELNRLTAAWLKEHGPVEGPDGLPPVAWAMLQVLQERYAQVARQRAKGEAIAGEALAGPLDLEPAP